MPWAASFALLDPDAVPARRIDMTSNRNFFIVALHHRCCLVEMHNFSEKDTLSTNANRKLEHVREPA